jgi:hypothetical protein
MKQLSRLIIKLMLLTSTYSFAGEGMWMPQLLKAMNEKEMRDAGLQISIDEIYNTSKSSMKDAVCLFGAGCTAEVISDKGLILTNHHCGFDAVQQLSSIENDYLSKGFWAKNQSEEKPCSGLSVTFIVDIREVTNDVLSGINDTMIESQRNDIIKRNIEELEKKTAIETKNGAMVKSFFGGNNYFLFITETFKDIRLVGVPPSSIGKFGADGDNWMWPRHTGDFSIFRIYANDINKPADYSPNNIPYKPKYSFSINLNDVKENDFTMVYGFPGRTTEYLPSEGIDLIRNVSDPIKVTARTTKLAIWDAAMRANDTTRLQYAAKYASVANGWKKWQGEMKGIDRTNIIKKRRETEIEMSNVGKRNSNLQSTEKFFAQFDLAYEDFKELTRKRDTYFECALGVELFSFCNNLNNSIVKIEDAKTSDSIKKVECEKIRKYAARFYKDFRPSIDTKVYDAIFKNMYDTALGGELRTNILKLFSGRYPTSTDVYSSSVLTNKVKGQHLIDSIIVNMESIKNDIAFKLSKVLIDYYNKNIAVAYSSAEQKVNALGRTYISKMMAAFPNKKFYPDANSTLRIAFGNVKKYQPRDGVTYDWYTTYKGILEKENPNNDDYVVDAKLKKLFIEKDFGNYADANGELRIAFIASNHTTGGNSGSPVLNANGELIGTNFDRCWEGTMSDIVYDPEQCRNITLDIHYTLFVVDKLGGAGYLLNEMKIIKK